MTKTMVFSFLPKLVKEFGVKEVNTGYKVGLVVCSLYVGRAIVSVPTGYLADTKGRKLMIILFSTLLAAVTIVFGFSSNYEWTIVVRFLQGCTMGVDIVSKALVAEHCDETNTPFGMSFVIAAFNTGMIIGPAFAAVTAFPADLYPDVFKKDSLFGKYVILLPCLLFSFSLLVCVVLSMAFLPPDKNKDKAVNAKRKTSEDEYEDSQEDTQLITEENDLPLKNDTSKMMQLLRTESFLATCAVYGFTCFNAVAFDEMFPVYAATSKLYHGYNFSTVQIGESLFALSFVILVLEITLIPRIFYSIGARKIFMSAGILLALFYPLVPAAQLISNNTAFWIAMLSITFVIRMGAAASFVGSVVLVNNSVNKHLFGMAHGMSITFGTLGRMISPITFGLLFTWSLQNIKGIKFNQHALGFPFNHYFIFIILSVSSLIATMIVFVLPPSLDKPNANT